jgi:hypothetical protein
MDRWLNNAPALAYINQLSIWVVVNSTGRLIAWTSDRSEALGLATWILEYDKNQTELKMDTAITAKQPGSKVREMSPVSPDRGGVRESVRQRTRMAGSQRSVAPRGNARSSNPLQRQLIGEQIGPTRMLQVRLFKTQEEAETWTRAAVGRRFRLAKIGSAVWIRALSEELRVAQRGGFAEGSGQQTNNPPSSQAERRARELSL